MKEEQIVRINKTFTYEFIRKRMKRNSENVERHDKWNDKACVFFFPSKRKKRISRATSHRMQIVITLETCMHYRRRRCRRHRHRHSAIFKRSSRNKYWILFMRIFRYDSDRTSSSCYVNMNMLFAHKSLTFFFFLFLSFIHTFYRPLSLFNSFMFENLLLLLLLLLTPSTLFIFLQSWFYFVLHFESNRFGLVWFFVLTLFVVA